MLTIGQACTQIKVSSTPMKSAGDHIIAVHLRAQLLVADRQREISSTTTGSAASAPELCVRDQLISVGRERYVVERPVSWLL